VCLCGALSATEIARGEKIKETFWTHNLLFDPIIVSSTVCACVEHYCNEKAKIV